MPERHLKFPLRFALRVAFLVLCVAPLLPAAASTTRPAAILEPGYVAALGAADHFLQAWQAGDVENGLSLLTGHAKEKVTADALEEFFSAGGPLAYEIDHGRLVKRGRYEFPVVLVSGAAKNMRVRRRFSSIVVVNTGNNDWALDKLP